MSSQFNPYQTSADHLRERQQDRLLEWAEGVFAEPKPDGNDINPRLYELGYISHEQETVLYKDLHSRDSEVGLGLLDWRKAELLDSVAYLRTSIKKREHMAVLARSRREALERLAASGQVSEDHYAQPQAELIGELVRLEMELNYLRAYGSKIDALERLVKLVGSESSLRVSRTSEQMLRLFSQSWRGLVKIKAWAQHFGESLHLPHLQTYKQPGELAGFLLPLGDGIRAVAISRETAGYLLHMLEAINVLAEAYVTQLNAGNLTPDSGWSAPHRLIRAIVELFYFCNFELPFSYIDLAVDPEDPTQLWVYDYQSRAWQIVTEDANSSRTLKRVGAEAAQMLINGSGLLKCRRDDDLGELIGEEAPQLSSPGETHNYRLFMCSGLSEFDLDPASQRIKFRMAFGSMGRLLKSIVADQEHLLLVSESLLGGPLETLLGMALIDARAFSHAENIRALDPIGRFQILSQFWRAIGRRRAISMLGEDYVKQVTGGLASLGEAGPDHPTFLTMRAGTLYGFSQAGGSAKGTAETAIATLQPINPFAALGLADQIRLLDLTAQSWAMAEEMLEKLREVHSQGKLRRLVDSLPAAVEARKEDIQLRFNTKWLTDDKWCWTFMRTCSPVVWDFWTKISSDEKWDDMLRALPAYQALGLLLRLFSDIVRLLLVIELSGAEVGESLHIEAESAGQVIVRGLEGFLEGGERLPPQVAEAVNFYYDPEIRFDSWLAFTSSFCRYLRQMGQDLKVINVDPQLLTSNQALIDQIEILYPVNQMEIGQASPASSSAPAESLRLPTLDEAQIQYIENLAKELLGATERDKWTFLKLLSLAARDEKRNLLTLAVDHCELIATLLPNQNHRALLFNLPSTTKNFFNFLTNLEQQGKPSEEVLNQLRASMHEYFEQLNELYQTLVPLTNKIPHLLPADRDRLAKYLATAPQKSSGLSFLLLLACNRLILDISDWEDNPEMQAERAEAKLRNYLREQLNAPIEEPSVEIYPIGSGRILARQHQCILTAYSEGFEPLWSELSQPASQSLYARFITTKFALAVELLTSEFSEYQVLVH
ncbi:MAG: hypothetical protein AB1489_29290 [Acidobacteriota bacterium]